MAGLEGTTIGAYRLLRELGRGGMSTVWLAARADGAYEQQVAVKMIARDRPRHDQVERRFRTERQILASLDHPGIAKLLDGGTLPDGTAFLVMEYVAGSRIDQWCQAQAAPARRRVALMVEVASAVEAAHQRLIVHRDLKPGNILVTAEGKPKLLDFGIAKLLEPASDWDNPETEAGGTPLTPRYASPEQARGQAVGTASDVFSLGVVLYELLSGRWPFGSEPTSDEEVLRRVCQAPATPPSLPGPQPAQAAEGLSGELGRDLDAIVLRALAKQPGDRYSTVGAFADDLRRALEGWPVLARRGTGLYRAGKFLRRHALAAAATAAALAAVTAAAVGSTLQARALAAERDRVLAAQREAAAQAAAAREVTRFLVDVLQGADPETTQGRETSLRELLDRGAGRAESELVGQPAVQAPLLEAMGSIYEHLSEPEKGRRLLEKAVALRAAERARSPLAHAEAVSRLAWLLRTAGEPERALALSQDALGERREHLGADHPATLEEAHHHAVLLLDLGRYPEAERELEALVQRWLAVLGLDLRRALESPVGPNHDAFARALHARGMAAYYRGRFAESALWYEAALGVVRRVHGPRHTRAAVSLTALAAARIDQGEPAEALALLDEALSIRRAVHGDTHASLAGILVNRAAAYEQLDRWADVERDAREAERIYVATLGPEHPEVAGARNNRAVALRHLGRSTEALQILEGDLAALERRHPQGHVDLVPALLNRGDALMALGRNPAALRAVQRGTEMARRLAGPAHLLTGQAELALARALAANGRTTEASALLRELLVRTEATPDLAPLAARAAFELARQLRPSAEGGEEARRLAEGALQRAKAAAVPDPRLLAEITAWLDKPPPLRDRR